MRKTMFRWLIALAIVVPCLVFSSFAATGTTLPTTGSVSEGRYVLGQDVTLLGSLTVEGDAVLDLNGNTLNGAVAPYFDILPGAKLTITDSMGGGKVQGMIEAETAMLYVEAGGELVLENGALTGHTNSLTGNDSTNSFPRGGAISNEGTVTMRGGEISGNTACFGGAIYAHGGSVTNIYGGTISGNTATYRGAISTHEGNANGQYAVINMTGGTISGNVGMNSMNIGGLYLHVADVHISGGSILDASRIGSSTIEITGGTVVGLSVRYALNGIDTITSISGNPVIREFYVYKNQNNSNIVETKIGRLTSGAVVVMDGNSDMPDVLDDTVATSGMVYYCAGNKAPCGDNVYWDLTDGVLTISGSGAMWDFANSSGAPWYDMRSTITTVIVEDGVTEIGDHAFYNCSNLTRVSLGDDVQRIGRLAFYGNYKLTAIEISANVAEIGEKAFAGGSDLTITVAPENPNYCTVDGVLFTKDMTRLMTYPGGLTATSYTIPNSVTGVDPVAFWNASKLQEVTIHTGVTYLGENVFYNCRLKRINLAEGNTAFTMLDGALYTADMTRLVAYETAGSRTFLHIPEGVVTVDDGALRNAKALTSICLPDSVMTGNGHLELYNVSSLRSMVIGSGVTSIGANSCPNLSDVYYVGNEDGWTALTNRSSGAILTANVHFAARDQLCSLTGEEGTTLSAHCAPVGAEVSVVDVNVPAGYVVSGALVDGNAISGLTFTVSGNHTVRAAYAPYNTSGIVGSGTCGSDVSWVLYEDGELYIFGSGAMDDYADSAVAPWYDHREEVAKVTLADGVTLVGGCAFMGCVNLTELTIPKTVKTFNGYAAYGCDSLTTITVDAGNTVFCAIDNVLYRKDMTRLVLYPAGRSDTTYIMPDSVTTTWTAAFAGAANLQQIVLSRNLQSCYSNMFDNCTALTSIEIPSGVTKIGSYAFKGCISLVEVTFPKGVIGIYQNAFDGCSKLERVEFLGDAPDTVAYSAIASSGATIYYHEGTDGWTDSEYYNAQESTWCDRPLVMIEKPVSTIGLFSLEVVNTIVVDGQEVQICRWVWTPVEQ